MPCPAAPKTKGRGILNALGSQTQRLRLRRAVDKLQDVDVVVDGR
jgi:hypothetical protein